MIESQAFPVEDFSGGITDNYLSGNPNKYRFADNFLVTPNKKLYSRPGQALWDETNYLIPSGNQRIGALMALGPDLFIQSSKKIFYINGTYQTLQGPTGNDVFEFGDTAAFVSWSTWNDHLYVANDYFSKPQKIYKDNLGAIKMVNAGLPALASTPTVTPAAGANTYLYAFAYYFEYTVGNRTFADYGPTTIVEVTNAEDPSVSSVNISAIPTLSNGLTYNYATASIKVKIFRTINAGTDFYYVTEVTNGTATAVDSVSDANLQSNEALYTNDGTLPQQEAPRCKYLHVANNIGWYAYIKEGTEIYKNRVIQSFQYNPDSVNSSFFVEVDDEITGLSSYNFTPLIFCKKSVHRIDGNFDDAGLGGAASQKITDTTGCVSNRSIIKTKKGTFFCGDDGFYWTDAFQVVRISTEFNDRFKAFIQNEPEKIYGGYDEKEDRVFWCLQEDSSSMDNDSIYVFDLSVGVREDGCFTVWKGGDSFRPTAILYFNKTILRADTRGYLFKFVDTVYSDLKVDMLTTPNNWVRQEIIYYYESCAYNFGTTFVRKWVPRIVVTCSNETNLSLQTISINDKGKREAELRPIYFKNAVIWGDDDIVWGDPSIIWNYDGIIEEQRRFPAKGLRCSYKQIAFTNAYVEIETSSTSGQATVNSLTKQVSLVDALNKAWPSASVGYFVSFSSDNYEREYLVTARTASTLTVQDTAGNLVTGTFDWKLKGYPKNQVLNLLGYNLEFAHMGKTQPSFGTSGGA